MIPDRLGKLTCKPQGSSLLIHRDKRVWAKLGKVWIEDNGETGNYLSGEISIIPGENWRGWFGKGSVITRTFKDSGRTIVETVKISEENITVNHAITYNSATEVFKHFVELELLNCKESDLSRFITSKTSVRKSSSKEHLTFEDCELAYNLIIDPQGNKVSQKWNVHSGNENFYYFISERPAPQMLATKDGAQATFVWTFHADVTPPEVVKAMYYGSSNELDPEYNTQGFIPNGLVTTQSVYAIEDLDNPSDGQIRLSDPDTNALMLSLYSAGCEIIPHTIHDRDDYRDDAIEGLPYFVPFSADNWIDHALGAGARTIGLKSEGAIPESPNYIMDLLETYGYKFAWSYIDFPDTHKVGLDIAQHNIKGSPMYLAYKNSNLCLHSGEPMIQWSTQRTNIGYILSLLTKKNVDDFVERFGLLTLHEYLIDGVYTTQMGVMYNKEGDHYKITPEFEEMLEYLSDKQSQGLLWHPTQREFAKRIIDLDSVVITPTHNGFNITNSGEKIFGFTFLVPNYFGGISAGTEVSKRNSEKGSIYWLDLETGITEFTFM